MPDISATQTPVAGTLLEEQSRYLVLTSFAFSLLQSICTFAIAAGSLRIFLGLGSFLLPLLTSTPVQSFHRDLIRLPMLIFAVLGALINLGVLWQVRHLRNRPAAQWRRQPVTRKQRRSEALQFGLSIATLLFVLVEALAHHRIHGFYL